MTCPQCHVTAEPAATVENVSVCAHCGMSLVAEDGAWRTASYRDVAGFTSVELHQLRAASGAITRGAR
jgi:NMD protein affecting ribosome stability and mRNA decay